jgi:hypothetical protein
MWHPFNYLRRSWRIIALVILLVLTVLVARQTNQHLNVFPMNILEVAPNATAATIIIDCWKEVDPELKAARLLQSWDTWFILCYSTFLALACVTVADWLYSAEANGNRLGKLFAWLMWVAAILDYVENHAINKMLAGPIVAPWPTVSSISASIKFALIGTGSVYILSSIFVRLFRRKLLLAN